MAQCFIDQKKKKRPNRRGEKEGTERRARPSDAVSHETGPSDATVGKRKRRGPGILRDRPLTSTTFTEENSAKKKKNSLQNLEKMCEKLALNFLVCFSDLRLDSRASRSGLLLFLFV